MSWTWEQRRAALEARNEAARRYNELLDQWKAEKDPDRRSVLGERLDDADAEYEEANEYYEDIVIDMYNESLRCY